MIPDYTRMGATNLHIKIEINWLQNRIDYPMSVQAHQKENINTEHISEADDFPHGELIMWKAFSRGFILMMVISQGQGLVFCLNEDQPWNLFYQQLFRLRIWFHFHAKLHLHVNQNHWVWINFLHNRKSHYVIQHITTHVIHAWFKIIYEKKIYTSKELWVMNTRIFSEPVPQQPSSGQVDMLMPASDTRLKMSEPAEQEPFQQMGYKWTSKMEPMARMLGTCHSNRPHTVTDSTFSHWFSWPFPDHLHGNVWHFDEIFITGCTGSWNFRCSQWWKFR